VAFIDLQLPDIDGIALGAALRAQAPPGPRLVAYSASVHQAGEATRAGFEWFLSKPVSYETVADCLISVGLAAGVRLVDVPDPPALLPDGPGGGPLPTGTAGAELSPALRDRLAAAARMHNATELRVCLRELLQQTGARRPPAWLSQLERAVRAYDMRAVLAVVETRAA
jgi:CheY-like chemotaxis protein